MIQVIGIGSSGSKILEYIKNQKFSNSKTKYEFLEVKDSDDFKKVNFDEHNSLITICGLAGETSAKFVRLINKEAKLQKIEVKNIVMLPFSYEGKNKGVNGTLSRLIDLNPNVEIYSNDDVMNEVPVDMGENEMLRAFDKVIFNAIDRENQTQWNNYIFEIENEHKIFKAVATYSIKQLKLTLLSSSFKTIAETKIQDNSKQVFGIKNKDDKISNIKDVKEVATEMLKNYILKTN